MDPSRRMHALQGAERAEIERPFPSRFSFPFMEDAHQMPGRKRAIIPDHHH